MIASRMFSSTSVNAVKSKSRPEQGDQLGPGLGLHRLEEATEIGLVQVLDETLQLVAVALVDGGLDRLDEGRPEPAVFVVRLVLGTGGERQVVVAPLLDLAHAPPPLERRS